MALQPIHNDCRGNCQKAWVILHRFMTGDAAKQRALRLARAKRAGGCERRSSAGVSWLAGGDRAGDPTAFRRPDLSWDARRVFDFRARTRSAAENTNREKGFPSHHNCLIQTVNSLMGLTLDWVRLA